MTEPKLCPATMRWAAQHIRKFIGGRPAEHPTSSHEWSTQNVIDVQEDAFESAFAFAAESLERWTVEAELQAAKDAKVVAGAILPGGLDLGDLTRGTIEKYRSEPALTVDQATIDEHYGRIAYDAVFVNYDNLPTELPWTEMDTYRRRVWVQVAEAVRVEVAKAMKAVRGGS